MHSERYSLSPETATRINAVKQKSNGRVISTGTTCTRVLESLARDTFELQDLNSKNQICAASGETNIFIHPPYNFQVVDTLLTNFHLPQSTLIMLVSAFANRDLILEAYAKAVEEKYRFFSYGDCMLII